MNKQSIINIHNHLEKPAKSSKIPVNDWSEAYLHFGCPPPPKPLEKGIWIRWGHNTEGQRNYKYSAILNEYTLSIKDWASGKEQTYYIRQKLFSKQNFFIPDIKFIEKESKKEIKDVSKEFDLLPSCNEHKYIKAKNIQIPSGLVLKIKDRRLVIPFYCLFNKVISGWHSIDYYQTDGKWGKRTRTGSSTKNVCLPLGENDKESPIYICEGFSTACSVHSITGAFTFCVFGKNNLEISILKFLRDYPKQKIVVCLDHDIKQPFSTQVRNDRLVFLKPEKAGCDFNDVQEVEEEQEKLKTLTPVITFPKQFPDDSDARLFKQVLIEKKNQLLEKVDETQKTTPEFYDDKKIWVKNNLLILSGETESGKTLSSLKELRKRLEQGEKVVIWQHSESNRVNRYNTYFEDCKNKPIYSFNRYEILSHLEENCTLYIDSFDRFMQMKSTVDRNETATAIEILSYFAQFGKIHIIACHFQTKTSRKESDLKMRSGGGMSIINVARYCALIEKAKTDDSADVLQNEVADERIVEKEKSFITIQKGHRPGAKHLTFWIEDNGEIGDYITSGELKEIMKEKSEIDVSLIEPVKDLLTNLLKDDSGKPIEKIPVRLYNEAVEANFKLHRSTAWRYLNRLDKHFKYKTEGFNRSAKGWIYRLD